MSKHPCICRSNDTELLENICLFDDCKANMHDCICADHCAGDRLFQSCLSQNHLCVCHFDPHGFCDAVECLSDHHECCCEQASRCQSYIHQFKGREENQKLIALKEAAQKWSLQMKINNEYIRSLEQKTKELQKQNKRYKMDLDLYKSYIKMKSMDFAKNALA